MSGMDVSARMDKIQEIISGITELYEVPVRVGSRCEANVYYRVEDLTGDQLETIATFLAARIKNVCAPQVPQAILSMPGSYIGLARLLSRELARDGEALEVVSVEQLSAPTGHTNWLRDTNVILVNEVITTARTCLEAHTRATMLGATVLCWTAIIDRTFGPGPVSIVTAFTGEPVRLLEAVP